MAVLQKLRTKFGLAISIIVALGLLSFIIDPGQIQSAMQSMSSKYDVGNIAGKAVSYNDFQQDIERYTAISELMSGTSVKSEAEQQQIRNAAWQELIDRFLFIKNAKSAGIKVGEDELVALTHSDMVSPVLASNPVFCDEAGNYDPSRLADLVQTISVPNRVFPALPDNNPSNLPNSKKVNFFIQSAHTSDILIINNRKLFYV